MREIKFRAWDKSEREMVCLDRCDPSECWFEFDADGLHLFYMEQYFETGSGTAVEQYRPREEKEVVWLQFTGFKDSDNVEIYEGDILDREFKFLVILKNGAFWVHSKTVVLQLLTTYLNNMRENSCLVEIIGNRFENPELLEKYQL